MLRQSVRIVCNVAEATEARDNWSLCVCTSMIVLNMLSQPGGNMFDDDDIEEDGDCDEVLQVVSEDVW